MTAAERKSVDEANYATQVISDHERSTRATSAVSDRARNTCNSMHRTIRTSMQVKSTYDDTIRSLENTCRSRLLEHLFDSKKKGDVEKAIRANGNKPLDFFKLPSMLQR